jgi:asparagine synthase (glutamine-hydrolysing)
MTAMTASRPAGRERICGSVDVGPGAEWTTRPDLERSVARSTEGQWSCRSRGLDVRWSADCAHAVSAQTLCIIWGTPRLGDGVGIAPAATARQVMQHLAAQGAEGLATLRGHYGLVFVDARDGRVVLAVDRFSAETACHAFEAGAFRFSDRADTVPLTTRTVAHQSIYDYLYFHCIPAPATIFEEVRRVCNGGFVTAQSGSLREGIHWRPQFNETASASAAALQRPFRELIEGAVAVEAASTSSLGCFLSGGTDSSTVAGMLAKVTKEPVRSYSIGFDAQGYDEMDYARIAARHFGTHHHEYYVTAEDVLAGIPAVAGWFDQPFGNSSVVPAHYCAQLARSDGVTRMLAGDGGDELFGGNSRYRVQQLLEVYHHVPLAVRKSVLEPMLGGPLGRTRIPGVRHFAAYVRHSRVPLPDRLETFNLLTRVGAARVLEDGFLESVDSLRPQGEQRATFGRAPARTALNRMLYYDWKYTLADADLPKVRGAVALNGMTVGYPLLADELADFSLQLPARFKVGRLQLRWFFKRALRGFLPDAIIRKKKHGFGLPFGPWSVRHAGLREIAGDSLAGLERRGILRRGFRDELMGPLLTGQPGYHGELLWILMMLEQWLARHGSGHTMREPGMSPSLVEAPPS